MKTLVKLGLIALAAILMSGCATKSYVGMVDVVAIGVGAKPTTVEDKQYIQEDALSGIVIGYTPNISMKEVDIGLNDTAKKVLGKFKKYSGEPVFFAEYMNSFHSDTKETQLLILDKNGVVAWRAFVRRDINKMDGISDYGLTGVDTMSFEDAMEEFVLEEENADFDDEKKIEFPKDGEGSVMNLF